MFIVYIFILLVSSCGYAGEIPTKYYIPRVGYLRSYVEPTKKNTSRLAAAAMVLSFVLKKEVYPTELKDYYGSLDTMEGAAKVFKLFLGESFYDEEMPFDTVKYLLSINLPLFYKLTNEDIFVTIVGYCSHGIYIHNPENVVEGYIEYDGKDFSVATGWIKDPFS